MDRVTEEQDVARFVRDVAAFVRGPVADIVRDPHTRRLLTAAALTPAEQAELVQLRAFLARLRELKALLGVMAADDDGDVVRRLMGPAAGGSA